MPEPSSHPARRWIPALLIVLALLILATALRDAYRAGAARGGSTAPATGTSRPAR